MSVPRLGLPDSGEKGRFNVFIIPILGTLTFVVYTLPLSFFSSNTQKLFDPNLHPTPPVEGDVGSYRGLKGPWDPD